MELTSFTDDVFVSVIFLFKALDSVFDENFLSMPRAALAFCNIFPLFFKVGVVSLSFGIWVGGRMPDLMLLRADYILIFNGSFLTSNLLVVNIGILPV